MITICISVMSHALDPLPPVTNCHTFSDPLPLERGALYGRPLMEKMCIREIPDHIYNWLVNYFHQRGHITNYQDLMSRLAHINASIVQGSVIGPASYAVEASGLHPRNPRNVMSKFADDTYLLVGSKHLGS